MARLTYIGTLSAVAAILALVSTAWTQTTVYNNFGPDHGGWDYNFGMGWTVAGVNVPTQYGVEQAMEFTSTTDGVVTDIWVAFFRVPSSTMPDTVTIKLTANPTGNPPEPGNVMEEWIITQFETWSQWSPPHHLQGSGISTLQAGASYWLWAVGGETTWTGWCLNINPSLTCLHTLRREGENWLTIHQETASAFRVDVGQLSPLSVTLIPHNPPIQLPGGGGAFAFDATIENTTQDPVTFDAWIMVTLPNGNPYGPLIQRNGLSIPGGAAILRTLNQNVPGAAPPGEYTMVGSAGIYPDSVIDSDSFTFFKLPGDGALNNSFTWTCSGWDDNGFSVPSSQFSVLSSSPNPFNASTVARFEIRDASQVKLAIYDIVGREAAVLAEGFYPAGAHQAVWDASGMASGVYFARLSAGNVLKTQKLLLVK